MAQKKIDHTIKQTTIKPTDKLLLGADKTKHIEISQLQNLISESTAIEHSASANDPAGKSFNDIYGQGNQNKSLTFLSTNDQDVVKIVFHRRNDGVAFSDGEVIPEILGGIAPAKPDGLSGIQIDLNKIIVYLKNGQPILSSSLPAITIGFKKQSESTFKNIVLSKSASQNSNGFTQYESPDDAVISVLEDGVIYDIQFLNGNSKLNINAVN